MVNLMKKILFLLLLLFIFPLSVFSYDFNINSNNLTDVGYMYGDSYNQEEKDMTTQTDEYVYSNNVTYNKDTDTYVLNDEYKELHSAIVKNAEFTNERFYDMQLNQTIIKNSNFSNSDLSGLDLSDVSFENCDFSNANLSKSSFIKSSIVEF